MYTYLGGHNLASYLHDCFRSNLTKTAEKSSIEVFASNLKNLLLSAPLKRYTILAIDPGFTNGCKVAVISKTGQLYIDIIISVYVGNFSCTFVKNYVL